jgi:outer membrane receptor for ferrienterochelin and colicins
MKKLASILAMLCFAHIIHAQSTLIVVIKDAKTNEVLPGNTLQLTGKSGVNTNTAAADSNGIVLLHNIPAGPMTVQVDHIGYEEHTETLTLPLATDTLRIFLEPTGQEIAEVIVSSELPAPSPIPFSGTYTLHWMGLSSMED